MRSKKMRLTGHLEWMGRNRNAYTILEGKSEGKKMFERPRNR
jgi:hypothetical protein